NDNLRFRDINIQPDTLTNGQSVALNAIGTQNTNNLRYVFPGNFTVNAGATLAVGPNVPVLIGPSPNGSGTVTLADNGTLTFAAGDVVTLAATTYASTVAQITVGSGGLLKLTGTTFNDSLASGGTALIAFGAGGHFQATNSSFALSYVSLAVGATVGTGDLVGNGFDCPLYIPAIDVQYLSGSSNDNLRFRDIDIQPDTLTN